MGLLLALPVGSSMVGEAIPGGGTAESNTEDADRLAKDEVFFLLKNERRRAVIEYLLDQEGTAKFDDLVVDIAAREKDKDADQISYKERKSVHTSLYQSHLPKLQEAGVVEYDRRSGSVILTDAVASIQPYLDVSSTDEADTPDGSENHWQRAYVGLVTVIALAAVLHFLSLYRLQASTLSVVLLLTGLAFGISATLRHRDQD